jgi:hypothetical protein
MNDTIGYGFVARILVVAIPLLMFGSCTGMFRTPSEPQAWDADAGYAYPLSY